MPKVPKLQIQLAEGFLFGAAYVVGALAGMALIVAVQKRIEDRDRKMLARVKAQATADVFRASTGAEKGQESVKESVDG